VGASRANAPELIDGQAPPVAVECRYRNGVGDAKRAEASRLRRRGFPRL